MSDTLNVTAQWSKSSYNAGETMVATISGSDVHVFDTTSTVGPIDIAVVATDGATFTVQVPAVNVVTTTTTHDPVVIDVAAFNANQGGRIWTVSADKLNISATA